MMRLEIKSAIRGSKQRAGLRGISPHLTRAAGASQRIFDTPRRVYDFSPRGPLHYIPLWAMFFIFQNGCSHRISTFEVVDYREPGISHHYRETFDEAYYDIDSSGNVNIVIRRESPNANEPGESVTQVIYIHTVWRSIPGTTVAHRSQINGTVMYGIIGGHMGVTFEGAGSVFFRENRKKHELTGTLELVRLRPTKKLTEDSTLFHHAELSGKFFAKYDRRRVVRTINEINRLFGPLPAVQK